MECNIYPQYITSEIFGLPMIQRTVSVIVEPKKTLINNGLNKAHVLENENIRDLNDLINEVKEDTNHVQVYLDNSIQDQYKNLQKEQENINIKLLAGSSLQKISQIIVNSNYVNLLQGEYAPKIKFTKFLKPWRYTAYLILALITILMANRTLSYIQLTKYEKNLSARFLYEYRNIQPNANNISDPMRIISGLKNANPVKTDTSFFLTSLNELSKAMSSGNDILVTSITYQEDVTIIRLIAPNVTLLDTIRREINKNGIFQATILSTNQIANDVESRIEIKAVAL
jgi:type II secretory pathway component PulL